MKQSLSETQLRSLTKGLESPNRDYSKRFPGESDARQPVHTVYGGAHLFKHTTAQKLSEMAIASFETYAPNPAAIESIFKIESAALATKVHARVKDKLKREAVEDFRIDFEDGFGVRPDREEDDAAVAAAKEVAIGLEKGLLPPFIGIRIKTFSEELKLRSLRTLDLFLTTLCEQTGGKLPRGFAVTLPKIVHPNQVGALAEAFTVLERQLQLESGALKMELMIETPQSILDIKGNVAFPDLIEAARGHCIAAHFGTYDYTASLSITAEHQAMDHPACDFARNFMKVALAGTGIWLSDGATNIMPVEPHKAPSNAKEKRENQDAIHRAWRLSYSHIQHSLKNALYQGWDLHPAQLPVRYIALYSFFLSGLDSATARLKNFIQQAAKATLVGDVFDDAATGQGLLNYFLRAESCGAITEDEILATGLTLEEVRLRSFKKILEGRSKRTS